jgi:fumarate reductase flavoprotein subunit
MNPSQNSNMDNLQTDIVILGAGGAGLAAAVTAAEQGAKVIVLEKRATAGGNASMAEGFFAAESVVQQRNMVDARVDDLFKKAQEYYHWSVDSRILHAYLRKSADTVLWLEGKGIRLEVAPTMRNQSPLVWHVLPSRGAAIIKTLLKDCEALGVKLLYGTSAKKIVTDESGKVCGILATKKDTELGITTGCVIVATGGFGGNREMLKKSTPFYSPDLQCNGLHHMGEGILMAREAGAAGEGTCCLIGGGPCLPKMRGWAGTPMYLTAVAEEPNVLWINKKGERFVDECVTFNPFEAVNPLLRQPDMLTYSLFDEEIKRGIVENGIIRGVGIYFLPPRTKITNLDSILRSESVKESVKIANTWEEMAGQIKLPSQTLISTIQEYNSACDRGYDEIFGKDRRYLQALRTPPYYAVAGYPFFMTTIGGIKINHKMEAIDSRDDQIPGLYAAGMDAGGWVGDTYCGHLAGSGFGFALNSGRIAGENAARYMR